MRTTYEPAQLQRLSIKALRNQCAHWWHQSNIPFDAWTAYHQTITHEIKRRGLMDGKSDLLVAIQFEMVRERPNTTARERWANHYRLSRLRDKTDNINPFFVENDRINGLQITTCGGPLVVLHGNETAPFWAEPRTSFFYLAEQLEDGRLPRRKRWLTHLLDSRVLSVARGFKLP